MNMFFFFITPLFFLYFFDYFWSLLLCSWQWASYFPHYSHPSCCSVCIHWISSSVTDDLNENGIWPKMLKTKSDNFYPFWELKGNSLTNRLNNPRDCYQDWKTDKVNTQHSNWMWQHSHYTGECLSYKWVSLSGCMSDEHFFDLGETQMTLQSDSDPIKPLTI